MIPFPNEHVPELGLELMHVLDIDTMVDFSPNAGSRMKAVLLANKRGVAIVKNVAAKSFLMRELGNFTKTQRLSLGVSRE